MSNKSPSEIAFEELIKIIKNDSTLDKHIQEAFINDITSTKPNNFNSMKKLFKRIWEEKKHDFT